MNPVIRNGLVYFGIIVIMAILVKPVKKSRGHKNNNPFNLVQSKNKWLGKSKSPSDERFEQFENLAFGIRAGFINLLSYRKNGYKTIAEIIGRYSPQSDPENAEGSTESYAGYVAKKIGLTIHQPVPVEKWADMAWHMMKFENGYEVCTRLYFDDVLKNNKLT